MLRLACAAQLQGFTNIKLHPKNDIFLWYFDIRLAGTLIALPNLMVPTGTCAWSDLRTMRFGGSTDGLPKRASKYCRILS